MYKIAVLPCDGVGPEVVAEGLKVMAVAGLVGVLLLGCAPETEHQLDAFVWDILVGHDFYEQRWLEYGGQVKTFHGRDWVAIRNYIDASAISYAMLDADKIFSEIFDPFPDINAVDLFEGCVRHDDRGHPSFHLAYVIGFSRRTANTINWKHVDTSKLDNLADYFYIRPESRSLSLDWGGAIADNHNYGLNPPNIPLTD